MSHSNVVTGLTGSTVAQIHQLLDALEALLGFRIKLTPDERMALPAVGDRRISFVAKSFRYAQQHPALLPPFRNLQDFQRVYYDFNALQPILDRVAGLREGLSDTVMQIGSNCYDYSLMFYDLVGKAAEGGIPGTETPSKDLSRHFHRITSGSDDVEATPEPKDGGAIPGNEQTAI